MLSYGAVESSSRCARQGLGLLALALVACIDAPTGPAERDAAPKRTASAPANGFGDAIAWRGLDEGLQEAARSHRPVMLVVHASWCPRCTELKPAFGERELVELSERFVMVNVDQDVVPASLEFAPDGTYVPRIVFVDPDSGRADPALRNDRRTRTVYYYGPRDDLVGTMKKALVRHGETQS